MEQRFTDLAPMGGVRMTADGYLVAEVRCARTGCQDYLASELNLDRLGMDRGGVVTVYRPEEVVFDKASLATFAGKPVTMGHPADPVTAGNWKALAVGDIGTEIARDGEFVRVPLKLMDAAAIQAVQDGTREISMGYSTGLELRDGVAPDGTRYQAVQTGPIRINHLAIVPQARGGSNLRIGDEAGTWGASPIISQQKDADMADAKGTRTVMIDGLSVETTDAGAQALEKLMKDAAAAATAHGVALAAKDKDIATRDAELAAKDAEIAKLKAAVVDGAALDKLVADRAALSAKAKTIAPAVVIDGKSAAEIKRAVVIAKLGDDYKDKSDAYVDAAFDILADAPETDGIRAALGDAQKSKAPDSREAIYAARDRALGDAWKPQSDRKEA